MKDIWKIISCISYFLSTFNWSFCPKFQIKHSILHLGAQKIKHSIFKDTLYRQILSNNIKIERAIYSDPDVWQLTMLPDLSSGFK